MRTIYVYDAKNDRMVPKEEAIGHVHTNIMSDIQPYRSMIDGSVIGSRSSHRAHLREHGCVEVGNETMKTPEPTKLDREKSKRMIADKLWNYSDRDCDRIMKKLREGNYG